MVFAIKMLLDNTYGLLNLFEFKSYHFNSFYKAEYEFKNSNFGGNYIEIMSSLMFSNKYDFSSGMFPNLLIQFLKEFRGTRTFPLNLSSVDPCSVQ